MGPLRFGYCAATIVVAASRILKHRFFRMRDRRFMAMMRAFATTAGMRRRGFGRDRHRKRSSEKRDQEQKSGSNPLHADW